jgi:hypothetical protein
MTIVWQIRAWLTAVSGHLWMAHAHNSKELEYPWLPIPAAATYKDADSEIIFY